MLVLCNGDWVPPYEALTILALMFTGALLYRAEARRLSLAPGCPGRDPVLVLPAAAGLWHGWIWGAACRWQSARRCSARA